MTARFFLIPLYLISSLLLPWWFTVLFAIVLIAYFKAYLSAFAGGLIIDTLYSTSSAFGGVYLYTAVLALLIVFALALKTRLLE